MPKLAKNKGVNNINVYFTSICRASAAGGRCSVGVQKRLDRCAPGGSRCARFILIKSKTIMSGYATPF